MWWRRCSGSIVCEAGTSLAHWLLESDLLLGLHKVDRAGTHASAKEKPKETTKRLNNPVQLQSVDLVHKQQQANCDDHAGNCTDEQSSTRVSGCMIPWLRRQLFHRSAQWGRHARGGVLICCPRWRHARQAARTARRSVNETENAFVAPFTAKFLTQRTGTRRNARTQPLSLIHI